MGSDRLSEENECVAEGRRVVGARAAESVASVFDAQRVHGGPGDGVRGFEVGCLGVWVDCCGSTTLEVSFMFSENLKLFPR